jgi:urease accessory protein
VRHEYDVGEDAELHCHWDPVIPFADAALVQEFDLRLHSSARLYWSDALMSGRASRGEAWRFRALAHTLRLRVGGSLKYLERYRVSPANGPLPRRWVADTANYFATTLVHHRRATADESEALQRSLDTISGAWAAIDLLEPQLMIARVMAPQGTAFAAARAAIRASLLDRVFQKPALAGRK